MLTLREFIEKVNFREHYRIYNPNRDCLIFESYFTVHSPYYFDDKPEHLLKLKDEYFTNNPYCNDIYTKDELDDETKELLDRFGDYEVHSLEIGSFAPYNCIKDKKGNIHLEPTKSKSIPNRDYIDCFNVFIRTPTYDTDEYLDMCNSLPHPDKNIIEE